MSPVPKKIEKHIKKIIADQLGKDVNEIKNEMRYVDDLGADSLDIVELIMSIEEEFELDVPDEDAEKIITVQDTLDYVQQKISKV